jgi:rhodanese-related sulfurtransferase
MSVFDIDVEELARRRRDDGLVLHDVREDDELAAASIDGAVHIPMGQIAQRIGELDAHSPLAVMCHHGGRSLRVAHYLAGNGFAEVYNVDGGIDAYAERIDPSIPRY